MSSRGVYNHYDHKMIEKKWQKRWSEEGLYSTDLSRFRDKFYNLWMFPYPSAEGLHIGHAFTSTGSDIYGRYKRMRGKEVFQPTGYDSFGIHSENFAIKIGEHPQTMLKRTIKHYEEQLQNLGHGYDWKRTVTTSDRDYYRWTQWLFVEMFKAGLAYRAKSLVNWCPSCKTVLADEQVISNECERCSSKVEAKELEQWFFRITKYADRLLENLSKIDWSKKVVIAQRNWIGKKEGINIKYQVEGSRYQIICWTSRPETNFGGTFIALSPEHPLTDKITIKENIQKVKEYIRQSQLKTREERIAEGREKTGVFTGRYAINSLNGQRLPIWIANFVLMEVGTGAVVGVPGHDLRDFEFAKQFGLDIKRVVVGPDKDKSEIISKKQVLEGRGTMINSDFLNGLNTDQAFAKMIDFLEQKGWGVRETKYHLRDWLISRQRYWGPPIPMTYCPECARSGKSWFSYNKPKLYQDQSGWNHAGWYPEEKLPVELPFLSDFRPKGSGKGPLADHPEFYETICPQCGAKARRETDVSDTFLDSSWYFLRYPSVGSIRSTKSAFDSDITRKWLPVDLYFGGAEHAVLHLMYARFVTHVLYDLGLLHFQEPFPKLFAHGLIIKDGAKMSKSRGNVVVPDDYIEKYGSDTLRAYLVFMGPMDSSLDFRDTGIEGMRKFVERIWKLFYFNNNESTQRGKKVDKKNLSIKMYQAIKKVGEDIEHFRYNTAISAIMEYVNFLQEAKLSGVKLEKEYLKNLTLLIAPFMPHLAEELWVEALGEKFSIHKSQWPEYDQSIVEEKVVTIPVQVNGKLRGTLVIEQNISKHKEVILEKARNDPKIQKWVKDKTVLKEIYIPGRVVNFVLATSE